jgi:hypothetical protein
MYLALEALVEIRLYEEGQVSYSRTCRPFLYLNLVGAEGHINPNLERGWWEPYITSDPRLRFVRSYILASGSFPSNHAHTFRLSLVVAHPNTTPSILLAATPQALRYVTIEKKLLSTCLAFLSPLPFYLSRSSIH